MAIHVNTPYTKRARYYTVDTFEQNRPPVPAHVFLAERAHALHPTTPTGLIALDLSRTLAVGFQATTPLILGRYARIRSGEKITTRFNASGEIYYVLAGAGETSSGRDTLAWKAGDVFCLPGGSSAVHTAGPTDSVLLVVTNEPQLAFERLQAPAPGTAQLEMVHYPAEEIRRHLERPPGLPAGKTVTGKAWAALARLCRGTPPSRSPADHRGWVSFSSAALDGDRTCLPSLTLSMNSLPPGMQQAHRHNAVAVTLVVDGERCYSMIDGKRVAWERHAVMITPPGAMHSHHNDGDQPALFLIVQDGGLHYHCRTMGFRE